MYMYPALATLSSTFYAGIKVEVVAVTAMEEILGSANFTSCPSMYIQDISGKGCCQGLFNLYLTALLLSPFCVFLKVLYLLHAPSVLRRNWYKFFGRLLRDRCRAWGFNLGPAETKGTGGIVQILAEIWPNTTRESGEWSHIWDHTWIPVNDDHAWVKKKQIINQLQHCDHHVIFPK